MITTYDVFLSHASIDKPAVEALARRLREDALEPFLDTWHLVPGEPWQEALEEALETSRTCAVFMGAELGPWQNEEMRAALAGRVGNTDFRVIPVLLPGARIPVKKDLPSFLRRLTWIDFRAGLDDEEAYNRLVCGIRGVAPGDSGRQRSRSAPKQGRQKLQRVDPQERWEGLYRELSSPSTLLIAAVFLASLPALLLALGSMAHGSNAAHLAPELSGDRVPCHRCPGRQRPLRQQLDGALLVASLVTGERLGARLSRGPVPASVTLATSPAGGGIRCHDGHSVAAVGGRPCLYLRSARAAS